MKTLRALCLAVFAAASPALLLPTLSTPAFAVDPAEYGKLPAVERLLLSPSGERYAFVGTIGGKRVVAVAGPKKEALFVEALGDVKVRGLRWAGEDHVLLLLSKTENLQTIFVGSIFELETVLRINLKDKSAKRIFEGTPSVVQRVFGFYGAATEKDGKNEKAYGYFGGMTLEGATGQRAAYVLGSTEIDLYRVDLDSGQARQQARAVRDMSSRWLITPDAKIAATARYDINKGMWWLYAGNGRGDPIFQHAAPLGQIGLAGLGRTPGTYLVIDHTGDADKALEVKSDGSTEELFKEESVEEFLFDPASGLLIGARLDDRPYAMFFDPALDARWKAMVKLFPGVRLTLVSVNHDLQRMIIKSDAGQDSGTFWLAEANGKTTPLGQSYPALRASQVGTTQMFQYQAQDGLKMEGVLTLPPGSKGKNLPLVVLPHGGPIGVNDQVSFDWWPQAFAGNGYAVFQPNYRGSSGYGAAFRDAGYGEWGKKMLTDISDGMKALADRGIVDPKRACIVGGSYGGYAALAGVTVQQGLYKCAVSVAGVSDVGRLFQWETEGRAHDGLITRYRRAITGAKSERASALDDISPIHFANRADAPVLLIHGKDDTVVPIAQSGAMEDALQSANKPVEFIRMEGEDHWLSREDTRTAMIKASVAFVMKHNPPDAAWLGAQAPTAPAAGAAP